jgi:hypothetical protein
MSTIMQRARVDVVGLGSGFGVAGLGSGFGVAQEAGVHAGGPNHHR